MLDITRITDYGGDWEAIYFGDKLIDQNHSVNLWEVIELIYGEGVPINSLKEYEVEMEQFGRCDDSLSQFKKEANLD